MSRLRATAARDLAHGRQHVNAILLRHGMRYPEKTKWTQAHQVWLHRQRFDSPVLQFTYDSDVEQAELLAARLKRIDQRVAEAARDCQYAAIINALMCLRGIENHDRVWARRGDRDWTRFTGASIGSYMGLVPSEQSSGQSRHQGPMTKAGSKYARKLLVEAAWQHRRPYSRPGPRLLRVLDVVGSDTRIRALEGNQRLYHKWDLFDTRKKRSVTANTAIARELAGWCWSLDTPLQRQQREGQGNMTVA